MLETLRIQNFKSWQDTGDMQFGSLTGFFGTNSSGKSSILQFLLMLKQTVESSDRSRILHTGDDKSYVDLGTPYDILHMYQVPGKISFSFAWHDDNEFPEMNDYIEEVSHNFSAQVGIEPDKIFLFNFIYTTSNQKFELINIQPGVINSPPFFSLLDLTEQKNYPINFIIQLIFLEFLMEFILIIHCLRINYNPLKNHSTTCLKPSII